MIIRYSLPLLFDNPKYCVGQCVATISGLEPINFIGFAVPFLGTVGSNSWMTENVFSHIGAIQKTTDQLFFRDNTTNNGHLLVEMSEIGSSYMKSLGIFKHRILYSNIEGDHRISYHSGNIWPYKLKGSYWKKPYEFGEYAHIIVRPIGVVPDKDAPTFYNPQSLETQIAFNLMRLEWKRYDVYMDGWFNSFLNHNNLIVVDETINAIGTYYRHSLF
jgi:hypothetical protein